MRSLRRPRLVVIAVLAAAAAVPVAVPVATGSTKAGRALAAPTGLQTFLLRASDSKPTPVAPAAQFPRTPSFAWNPVRGAERYHFELSRSPRFGDGSVIWSSRTLRAPAATVPLSLPWLPTGEEYSLYWRVRAAGSGRASAWSAPGGFRMQWDDVSRMVPEVGHGYIRWTPVRGATGYEVWFVNLHKVISTTTTVADLRDYFHDGAPAEVRWRVRAARLSQASAKTGLPAASYGPWSETNTSPVGLNASAALATVSEGVGPKQARPEHRLMPAFLFGAKDPTALHHVYLATDAGCTNVVFNSAVVGGSAFAPRATQYAKDSRAPVAVNDGQVFMKDGRPIRPTEAAPSSAPGAWARIDLRDSDGPNSRYYWTVVPVERRANGSYHDLESPQEACRARKASFSKASGAPALAGHSAPFATGLSPVGNLFSPAAAPGRFYGFPLVAWKPAPGATRYELQWSRTRNPWRTRGALETYATSATLPLKPGTWWYRVRGLDASIPGAQELSWSAGQRVRITIPIFRVERS